MQRKINLTQVICFWMGKTYMEKMTKTPPCDFKVTTPENSLLSQQAVTSKGISVPSTNLQLNPYPNTQLDLFCSDKLSFSMHSSQYVTNQLRGSSTWLQSSTREGCWLQNSSVHHTMKIEKLYGHKTLRCTNTVISSQEKWTRANSVSGHNMHEQTLLNTCATCVTFNGP